MSGWQLIQKPPKEPTGVIFYNVNLVLHDQNGTEVNPILEPGRDEAFGLGFWDGDEWRYYGTGHEIDEGWTDKMHVPTHWMPLPPAPASGKGDER